MVGNCNIDVEQSRDRSQQSFSLTQNWRGKPLVSHQVTVRLIGSTTTDTGLEVRCEIDGNLYPKGIKVTDKEMEAINIARNEFHGEWNYIISPNQGNRTLAMGPQSNGSVGDTEGTGAAGVS